MLIMALPDHETRIAEANGSFNERLGVVLALEELDKVITPLEDTVRHLDKESVMRERNLDTQKADTADTLTQVVRTLRRGKGIGALTSVRHENAEPQEIITLENTSKDVVRSLGVIVEGGEPIASILSLDVIYSRKMYSTLARKLYMRISRSERDYTVELIAAGSERMAYKLGSPEERRQPQQPAK